MANHRPLPWRETSDPYKIWLSEVMLQQTRVAQGLPYYKRFVKSFPTVFHLAKAPEQTVLRLWQGLGYYSRARNLHRCAKHIVKKSEGRFPGSYQELVKLSGVGPYTAAAIASIAFREPVAVVDGNVFRVLSRIFGIETDIASSEGKKYFTWLANQLVDKARPGLFNQAVMEFGALHCLPKNPQCAACIFSKRCEANQKNLQSLLPVKSKKLKVRTRYFYYFIIRKGNKILLRKRKERDIWQGLYDFYLIEPLRKQRPETLIAKDQLLSKGILLRKSKMHKHILSHQKLLVKFAEVELSMTKKKESHTKQLGLRFFTSKEVARLPKPILIAKYLG